MTVGVLALHQAAIDFESRMADAAFLKLLRAFQAVGVLTQLEIMVRVSAPDGAAFGPLQYEVDCTVQVSAVPARMTIPGPDGFGPDRDLVASFVAAGYGTQREFQSYLSQYLNEVWPAFADVGHLFGGVGQVKLDRSDISRYLATSSPDVNEEGAAQAFRQFALSLLNPHPLTEQHDDVHHQNPHSGHH